MNSNQEIEKKKLIKVNSVRKLLLREFRSKSKSKLKRKL